jgi:hypothetical protein
MKKLIILLDFIVLAQYCFSQSVAIDIGFATTKSAFASVIYQENKDAFSVGFSYQFNNATGKKVSKQLPNYGTAVKGTGDYFYTVDIGYARTVSTRLYVGVELSIGQRRDYTNYTDERFSAKGYHMVRNKEFLIGPGARLGFNLTRNISIFATFNTIRKAGFGFRCDILN